MYSSYCPTLQKSRPLIIKKYRTEPVDKLPIKEETKNIADEVVNEILATDEEAAEMNSIKVDYKP